MAKNIWNLLHHCVSDIRDWGIQVYEPSGAASHADVQVGRDPFAAPLTVPRQNGAEMELTFLVFAFDFQMRNLWQHESTYLSLTPVLFFL